jgi:tetratricopeptide (TPR) repeat protein
MAYQSEIEKLQRRYEEKPEQWFAAYADAYRKAGELDVALEIVRSGIEERPNYVSGYIVLGRCLVDLGKDSEAQEAFEQVLALDAENIIALSNLGEVSERAGDVTGARRWIERLLEVDPMNDKARHSLERLATVVPAPPEIAEEAPGEAARPTEEPADQSPSVREEPAVPTALEEQETSAGAEPPVGAPRSEAEPEPPSIGAIPEPTFADTVGSSDRFAPAEPGPDLVSADEEPASIPEEEDVSSVFGAAVQPPESVRPDDARDRSQFFIERHSDPFETTSQAQEAQNDAAALWASLGEDPELESVPDAEATAHHEAPESRFGIDEEPLDIAAVGESAKQDDDDAPTAVESSPEAPWETPVSGTTQMSAAELNALVERERQEAQERDRGAAGEDAGEAVAEASEEDEELIGGPPPEYQLERPEPRRASGSVPLFSDPDLLSVDSLSDDVESPEVETSASFAVSEPEDEPELMMPSALEEGAAESSESSDIQAPEPALSMYAEEADDVVTETMAEVYAAQGLFAAAKDVYRKLLERRPGDRDVEARLAAMESREHEAERIDVHVAEEVRSGAPSREFAASRTGGISARMFLAGVLGERPHHVSVERVSEPPAATTVLDETFASDRPDSQGQPTRPAADEMSLASVFGDGTPDPGEHPRSSVDHVSPPPLPLPSPSAGQQPSDDLDMSFDSFFSSGPESIGGPPAEEDSERDDDDEDFKAWLTSLKS